MNVLTRQAGVVGSDISGDRDLAGVCGSTAGDGDLCAGNVPLRRAGDVQSDLFNADEVVAVFDALGDSSRQLSGIEISEAERGAEDGAPLRNLGEDSLASRR